MKHFRFVLTPFIKPGAFLRLWLLIFLSSTGYVQAQFYNGSQMDFGKNRVQYNEERIWSHFRFEQFDTYFYQEGRALAINVAKYAYKAIPAIEQKLGYTMDRKIQFIVFNRLSELKSSNVGLDNEIQYNTGGLTDVVETKVFLYFDGSYTNLERQIRYGVAWVLVNQMIYGEALGSNIKNSTLMSLPEWFTKGLVSFLAEEWNSELDNTMREGFISGRYKKFNHLTGTDAIIAGHSAWKWVVDRYGYSVLPSIIYMTRLSRNVETGFLYVIGMSFKNLMAAWRLHYEEMYLRDVSERTMPDGQNTPFKIRKNRNYYQVRISPDERYIAFATDRLNRKKIWLFDTQTEKLNNLYTLGPRVEEQPDFSFPLIAWHPSSRILSWIVERKGRTVLYVYDLEYKTTQRINIDQFSKILDFSYSPNGQMFVMSAIINGQSDIFTYSVSSKSYERLTKDIYDDINPRFIENGRRIIFSSNRDNDTLVFDKETFLTDYNDTVVKANGYDLFVFDYQSRSNVLLRVTNSAGSNELMAMPYDNNQITYLSDESGIFNKYVAHFDSIISFVDTSIHYRYFTISKPISNFAISIREYDRPLGSQSQVDVFTRGQKSCILLRKDGESDVSENFDPLPTSWKSGITALSNNNAAVNNVPDTGRTVTYTYLRPNYYIIEQDTNAVDINNYRFISEERDTTTSSNPNDSIDEQANKRFVLPKQRNYDVEYSLDQLVNQVDFNFLNTTYQPFTGYGPIYNGPGANMFIKMGLMDLLEDYRITGGMRLSVDFNNNEYFLSYEKLNDRLDKQIVVHRMSYESSTETSLLKHHLHDIRYIMKWPINQVFSLRPSFMAKYDNQVYLATNDNNLRENDLHSFWAGAKVEAVYDNTRTPLVNIYYGTRYKIFAEYYQGVTNKKLNLITLGFDYRHYSKIHRTLIWANRIAAGTSFGSTRLIYFLGGVDNWFLPQFNYNQSINSAEVYAFQTLATNMRGFKQNIRNGNTFAVINSELRFPVFRYLFNRPLKSEFLNNFQLVAFGDLGSAWTGLNPYSEENTVVPTYYYQKPILVTIQKPRNPLVGGFGGGLRTRLLGYFLRVDLAWGVEEGIIHKPKLHLSLSLDF